MSCGGNCKCVGNCRCGKAADVNYQEEFVVCPKCGHDGDTYIGEDILLLGKTEDGMDLETDEGIEAWCNVCNDSFELNAESFSADGRYLRKSKYDDNGRWDITWEGDSRYRWYGIKLKDNPNDIRIVVEYGDGEYSLAIPQPDVIKNFSTMNEVLEYLDNMGDVGRIGQPAIGVFAQHFLRNRSYPTVGDWSAESHDFPQKSAESFGAETFGAFSIDKDDEGKIHIENKCDGCGKDFLFTQNSNIVGGNRAGAIVYENLEGVTGHDYPEYSPYGDLLCKSCWREEAESDWDNFSRMAETFEAFKYGENNKYWKMRKNAYLRNNKRINSYEEKDWENIFKNGIAPQNDEEMVEWIKNHQLTDDNLKYGMSRANTLSRINAVLSSYFDERMYFRPYGAESFAADGSGKSLRRDVIYEAWSKWKDGVFPHQMDNLTTHEVNWLYEKGDAYPPFDIEDWYKNTPETFNAESFSAEGNCRGCGGNCTGNYCEVYEDFSLMCNQCNKKGVHECEDDGNMMCDGHTNWFPIVEGGKLAPYCKACFLQIDYFLRKKEGQPAKLNAESHDFSQKSAESFAAENRCSICSGTGHNSRNCPSPTMSICGKCGGSDFISESYYDGQIYCQKCEVFIPTNELKTVKNPKWKEMFGAESFSALDYELNRNDCCELWVEKLYDGGKIGFGEAGNLLAAIEMDGLKCSQLGSAKCHKNAESFEAESGNDDMIKRILKRMNDAGYDLYDDGELDESVNALKPNFYVDGVKGYFDISDSDAVYDGEHGYWLALNFHGNSSSNWALFKKKMEKIQDFQYKIVGALVNEGILEEEEDLAKGSINWEGLKDGHIFINDFDKPKTKSCSHDNLGIKTMEQLNGELLLTLVCDACGKRTSTSAPIESDAWDAESHDFSQKSAESFSANNVIACEECGNEIGTKEEIMEDMVEAHKVERNNTVEILCEACYHEQPLGSLREDYDAEHNQTRVYRNLGIGAALVAGLAYWFKR